MKIYNMVGEKFNMLTVLEECNERDKYGGKVYKCRCDCGNIHYVRGILLRNNVVKSCGCLKHKGTHKKRNTRLYSIWNGIKQRCNNKNNPCYNHYGGRGIKVCNEWLNDFQAFYDWSMSHDYKKGLTIDRIDVNGDYEPCNCRWVDWGIQINNRRNNVYLTYNGKTQTMMQWANELDVPYPRLNMRHQRGWNTHDILFGKE